MVKKLAGHADKTAAWVTNVGNEYGQVLMSVLTEGEGDSLDLMLQGIIHRYADAGVAPPELLYVDRDCCNTNSPAAKEVRSLARHDDSIGHLASDAKACYRLLDRLPSTLQRLPRSAVGLHLRVEWGGPQGSSWRQREQYSLDSTSSIQQTRMSSPASNGRRWTDTAGGRPGEPKRPHSSSET